MVGFYCLLEFLGMAQEPPMCVICRLGKFMQQRRIGRVWKFSLANGCDQNLQQWCQWTSRWLSITIKWSTGDKNKDRNNHHCHESYICCSPANMILDVNNDGYAKQETRTETEVPPIKVRHFFLSFFRVVIVELVGSKTLKRWLVATSSYRD